MKALQVILLILGVILLGGMVVAGGMAMFSPKAKAQIALKRNQDEQLRQAQLAYYSAGTVQSTMDLASTVTADQEVTTFLPI